MRRSAKTRKRNKIIRRPIRGYHKDNIMNCGKIDSSQKGEEEVRN